MSCYFVANIKIHNAEEYRKYIEKSGEIFQKYKGEYLAVDNSPKILEGNWNYTRVVIIRFDSEIDFNAWYNSDEYREILKYRLNAANCDTVLARSEK